MFDFLKGYRTYILAAVAGIGGFVQSMGWMTKESWDTILNIVIIPLLAVTVHAAVVRGTAKVVEKVETVEVKVEQVPIVVAQAVAPVVAEVATQVAQETVAASVPPLVQLTNLSPERR